MDRPYTLSKLRLFINSINTKRLLVDKNRLQNDINTAINTYTTLQYTFGFTGIDSIDFRLLPESVFNNFELDIDILKTNDEEICKAYLEFISAKKLLDFGGFFIDGSYKIKSKWKRNSKRKTEDDHVYSSSPNIQGIPKQFRHRILPLEKGHKLVSCDYSTFQLRVLAYLSGDTNLIQLCNGEDPLVELKDIFFSSVSRGLFKTFMYSFLFGAGDRTLASILNISSLDLRVIMVQFYEEYPQVLEFKNSFKKHGEMQYEISKQSTYIFNKACIELYKKVDIQIPLHDAIIISVPIEDKVSASQVTSTMKAVGESLCSGVNFYAKVENKKGEQWGIHH
jgi:hypothetical protein